MNKFKAGISDIKLVFVQSWPAYSHTNCISIMQVAHYAFVGSEDEKFASGDFRDIETKDTLLEIVEVPGDHGESVRNAAKAFLMIAINNIDKA